MPPVNDNRRRLDEADGWGELGLPQGSRLLEELRSHAREAQAHAHAPYSGLRLGTALLASDGTIHSGCNVENASFGLTICAERVAAFSGVGKGGRGFRCGVLVSSTERPVLPCGACRQVLFELGDDLRLACESRDGTEVRQVRVADLLPDAMGAEDLPRP